MAVQEVGGVFASLTNTVGAVGIPGARLFNQPLLNAQLDDLSGAMNSAAVHDLKFRLAEWRRHLVLDDLHASFVTHYLIALFHRTNTTNVESYR